MNEVKLGTDVVLKEYWQNNDQFADLFNALLFNGQEVISPKELEERDTDESLVFKGSRMEESIKRSRDVIKVCKSSAKYNVDLALLGIENQMKIHYAMPLRTMEYDCFTYKKQYQHIAGVHKLQKDIKTGSAEFLSRMAKNDKLRPVITVVIYYGSEAWDGPLSLYDILEIPQILKDFVNDYKMLLVEVRQNSLRLKNENNQSLFQILKYALDERSPLKRRKAEILQYCDEHEVSESVLETVGSITGSRADYDWLKKREVLNMRTIFEEEREEGRVEGRKEAREEAIKSMLEFGVSEEKILLKYSKDELNNALKSVNHAGMISV